jgi:PKD domain
MRITHRIATLTIAALLPFAAAASASAAGWLTGPPVSASTDDVLTPLTAVLPTGERIVAWQRLDQMTGNRLGLAVRVAQPGADFGPMQLIADPSEDDPSLRVGSDGTAALVWASDQTLHIATRAPGQQAFAEAPPFPLGGFASDVPRATMRGGDVYVTLATRTDVGTVEVSAIQAAWLPARGAAILPLPGTGQGNVIARASFDESTQPEHVVAEPTIALSGASINVAWEDMQDAAATNEPGVTKLERAVGRIDTAMIGDPVTVDTVTDPTFFRGPDIGPVVAAGGGHVDVVYTTPTGRIAYQDVSGTNPIQTVTPDGGGFNTQAAIDPAGSLVLAWQRFTAPAGVEAVFSAIAPAAAPVQPVARLTPPNANNRLDQLVAGPDGSALALIDRAVTFSGDNVTSRVQASVRPAGGSFGALEEISGPQDRTGEDAEFDVASAAIGTSGQAVVGWTANDRSGTSSERVFVSARDATAPVIGAVSVPTQAGVQTPVTMSATAVDLQSTAAVSWDFGDGSQGDGNVVSHAYGAPGVYLVTVTATDASGNSASQSRAVAVAAPDTSDHTAPVISKLSSSHRRFRVAANSAAQIARKHKRAPAGTVFALRVSERSTLVLSFSGHAGRRHALVTPPPLVRTARGPGSVALAFSGRIAGVMLAPGSYRMSVVAIDPAGNRSRPATVAFTVVSR